MFKRTIKGHEYWYESKRVAGKKNPVSIYIKPVDRKHMRKRNADFNERDD